MTACTHINITCHTCRDPSGVLTVQLCGMQSVACNITCITAQPDCSAAVIGLSSGQLLRLVVSQSTAATAHSNSSAGHIDELSTGISGVSNDHATETGSSLSAALDIVPIPRQHNAAVSAAHVSPNGQLLASLSAPDGVIVFREYSASATSFHVVSEAALPGASCLAWLPAMGRDTCQRLLLGCNDGQLVVRNHIGSEFLAVSLVCVDKDLILQPGDQTCAINVMLPSRPSVRCAS